jgi:hypothetical protein
MDEEGRFMEGGTRKQTSIADKKKVSKISVTLILVVSTVLVLEINAGPPVRAYPTDALFAHQINQTSGAIINYRPPSEIQKYINGDPINVQQVLQELVWKIYRASDQAQSSQVVNEITRQVGNNPEGFTGDSIFWFAYRVASGQTNKVTEVIGQVAPPPTALQSVVSFNNNAINDATYLGDAAQRFFLGFEAVTSGNTQPAGFTQSSYTSDICNNPRIVDISYKESDGQLLSADPSDNVAKGSPTVPIGSGIDYGVVSRNTVCKLNSYTNDPNYQFVQTIPNDQSLLADTTRQVFGQIILETAIKGGQTSAQQALINIVNTVVSGPSGSLSKAIFLIASVEASGNIAAANSAVNAVAVALASGVSLDKIPQLVSSILGSIQPSQPVLELSPSHHKSSDHKSSHHKSSVPSSSGSGGTGVFGKYDSGSGGGTGSDNSGGTGSDISGGTGSDNSGGTGSDNSGGTGSDISGGTGGSTISNN